MARLWRFASAASPIALLRDGLTHAALRILAGFLFFQHGYPTLFGTLPGSAEVEVPRELLSIFWWPGFLEVVGGFLIMIGLSTRPVAFIVA